MTLEEMIAEAWSSPLFGRNIRYPNQEHWLDQADISWDEFSQNRIFKKSRARRIATQKKAIKETKRLVRQNLALALTSSSQYIREYAELITKEESCKQQQCQEDFNEL
jgi:hypothetical protein